MRWCINIVLSPPRRKKIPVEIIPEGLLGWMGDVRIILQLSNKDWESWQVKGVGGGRNRNEMFTNVQC